MKSGHQISYEWYVRYLDGNADNPHVNFFIESELEYAIKSTANAPYCTIELCRKEYSYVGDCVDSSYCLFNPKTFSLDECFTDGGKLPKRFIKQLAKLFNKVDELSIDLENVITYQEEIQLQSGGIQHV